MGSCKKTQSRVQSEAGCPATASLWRQVGKWPQAPALCPAAPSTAAKGPAHLGCQGRGSGRSPPEREGEPHRLGTFLLNRPEEGHEDKDPASVSLVSPQVQVLLYYLQHPPISFAELKRNTLYFSTDV